jgi:CrcB protein
MSFAGLRDLFLVGAGGFIGAVSRYVMSGLVHQAIPFSTFPAGTLAVNVVGCFIIGLLGGLADTRSVIGQDLRLFMFFGVLGGFTTFSTFGYETLALVRDGEHARAAASVALHFSLCLGGAWMGYGLAAAR